MSKNKSNKEVYEEITNKVLEAIDKAQIMPWQRPWNSASGLSKSLSTGKPYRGINVWILSLTESIMGYKSSVWGTVKAINGKGGHVKKGQHGTTVYYWNFLRIPQKDDKGKEILDDNGKMIFVKIPIIKSFTVFNLDQTEGVKIKAETVAPKSEKEKISECEAIWENYKDRPEFGNGSKACYSPMSDKITMPKFEDFNSSEGYYSVLFHEAIHSTGHAKRLSREGVTNFDFFGSHTYGREELIAEFGASYLCGLTGISGKVIENSISYLDNWKKAIKADPAMLMVCATKAQKAVEHIIGKQEEEEA